MPTQASRSTPQPATRRVQPASPCLRRAAPSPRVTISRDPRACPRDASVCSYEKRSIRPDAEPTPCDVATPPTDAIRAARRTQSARCCLSEAASNLILPTHAARPTSRQTALRILTPGLLTTPHPGFSEQYPFRPKKGKGFRTFEISKHDSSQHTRSAASSAPSDRPLYGSRTRGQLPSRSPSVYFRPARYAMIASCVALWQASFRMSDDL